MEAQVENNVKKQTNKQRKEKKRRKRTCAELNH